ncbi:cyanophycin synthetase [Devosia albogilva]|uniref:Cyanophycin synthetase n=1 Tax=Devosia albogilva TaxID=429726 RepID=A0ABW5QFT0_9HYPH
MYPDLKPVADQPVLQTMKVVSTKVYRGPHLYSELPMIQIQLDLGALEQWPTSSIVGFSDRLTALLPNLWEHGCSYGEPGGFVRRMAEGTWLGHVIEHVAIELQCLVGMKVSRGKTRSVKGQPGVYNVLYCYVDETVGLAAGRLAVQLVNSLLPEHLRGIDGLDEITDGGEFTDLAAGLKALSELAATRAFGPTTASLIHEAERRHIPVQRLDDSSLILLGQGKSQKRIRASCTDLTSEVATEIAADKDLTKLLLDQAGLPVPTGKLVRSADEAVRAAEDLGYPVVTKPLDGNHGRGVNIDLKTEADVRWGFEQAREHGRIVIVERYFAGADHRILVIGGQVVAVAKRVPAHVVGDGVSSIRALIDEVNRDPRRGEGHSSVLTRIEVDECVEHFLAISGLTVGSIPAAGETVMLRPTANLSTGGTAIDRTDEIHPENALIARRAAQIVGLDIAGIDFVCPDISQPVSRTGGGIIEVNAGPGFRMHLEPFQGRPRNVARPVLEMLFPEGSTGRIPVFAITGTNGKSTTARMLNHILKEAGCTVGLTSTTGVYLDGQRVMTGDCSGPRSARVVLREPSVDAAVLECARGGILREGLAFDECDVAACLNVAEDHLGLKGIDTIEDLAAVKSVVVESVRRGGWSILNADNEHTAAMAEHAGGQICYFTLKDQEEWPDFLSEHVARGGRAISRQRMAEGWDIVIHEDNEAIYFMKVSEIPATLDGWAEFNVANALAAVAMAHCHRIPLNTIRAAMREFTTSFEDSPGRLNIHDGHGFRTILDYAHNPDGLRALGHLVGKMRERHQRVIGMVGTAGDRRDVDIRAMGELAAGLFDVIVFKEDDMLRGREPGTVAALMQ